MKSLLHPCYFGTIAQYVAIAKSEEVIFEVSDNFQKQTFRNRTYVYGANGKLMLNLPILHSGIKGAKRLYKDIQIEHQFNTLNIHWKSLESAYRTSPFFEFYEDDLHPLFESKEKFLLDFNMKANAFVCDNLGIEPKVTHTENYKATYDSKEINDLRNLTISKQPLSTSLEDYLQVFSDKHGFISNLSVLDLLFNLGPEAINYLERQDM